MITREESNAISLLRLLAMGSIVCCHLLQAYANKWAYVLNVGVQVFLIMSGYLYGHKKITDWKHWYKKRLEKLYVPYILFVLVMLFLYVMCTDMVISWKNVIVYTADLQGVFGGVKGLGNLWYMTAIALCYVITPLLQKFRNYGSLGLICLLVAGILQYCFFRFYLFYFSWLYLYAVGYFYALASRPAQKLFELCAFLALILILRGIIMDFSSWQTRALHDVSGFVIFIVGMKLFRLCPLRRWEPCLQTSDRLSYHIYLVHHVFILGPFSMIWICPPWNVLIIIAATIVSAVSLNAISERVVNYIKQ